MSLIGVQSGHNRGNRQLVFGQAVDWVFSLAQRQPAKPVINLEAFYDAGGMLPASASGALQGTAWDARAAGYLSLLSGAVGYSYGAYGLWSWGGEPIQRVAWQTALALPSSTQMRHLRTAFEQLDWWNLRPAAERILPRSNDATQQAVLAITSAGDAGMAYLPSGQPIQIDMAGFTRSVQATWFDPRTGQQQPVGRFSNGGIVSFQPPTPGTDWVLLLIGNNA